MSTSDTNIDRLKTIRVYILISALCLIINAIYALVNQGQTSNYITSMFLIPLIGGIIAAFISNSETTLTIFGYSILTLTCGSFLQGIMQNAYSNSWLTGIHLVLGTFLLIIGLYKSILNR